nr:leucine-rich repeat-containing protein 27-like [Leptinotarsa decemlineata]
MPQTDLLVDHSKEKLTEVPKSVLDMSNLKMLFLEGNFLTSLPEDIFWKLPKLMWLDLRNNMLEYLPKSIGYHENLENLLLTNNNLQKLPNELGLVSKLKALQVSDNPLTYPARKVIVEGTKAIKNYLKEQYEKIKSSATKNDSSKLDDELQILEEERVLSVVDVSSNEDIVDSNSGAIETTDKNSKGLSMCKLSFCDPYHLQPTFSVKKLHHSRVKKKNQEESLKIVHKISRTNSKIMLKSYFNKIGVRNKTSEKIVNTALKEGWLNQLRILLTDQERILQQER